MSTTTSPAPFIYLNVQLVALGKKTLDAIVRLVFMNQQQLHIYATGYHYRLAFPPFHLLTAGSHIGRYCLVVVAIHRLEISGMRRQIQCSSLVWTPLHIDGTGADQ